MKKEDLENIKIQEKYYYFELTGRSISIEQTKEIIRRTDRFFLGYGNDVKYNSYWRTKLHYPHTLYNLDGTVISSDKDLNDYYQNCCNPQHHNKFYPEGEEALSLNKKEKEWRKKWGFLDIYEGTNNYIDSTIVGGPCGWIHLNGDITETRLTSNYPWFFYEQWETIARAFPFLDIGISAWENSYSRKGIWGGIFLSSENENVSKEEIPLFGMKIQNGKVELLGPEKCYLAHKGHQKPEIIPESKRISFNYTHGLPNSWMEEYAILADNILK